MAMIKKAKKRPNSTTANKFKLAIFLFIVVYSTVRVLLASQVKEFEGSIWLLWLIDVGTAWPYVWGVFRMFGGKTLIDRLIGGLVAVPAFAAPYIYWYLNGEGYPAYVHLIVGIFILTGICNELFRYLRTKRK